MHIADLLNVNHHILEIDLFNNQIGKEGGEAGASPPLQPAADTEEDCCC